MSDLPPVRPLQWPAVGLLRAYRYSLSGIMGRQCRHWPTCSEYAEQAIRRHGLWAGAWMGFARICRCGPGGTHGIDLVCEEIPQGATWVTPWRYARWRGVNAVPPDYLRSDLPIEPERGGDSAARKGAASAPSDNEALDRR